MIFPVINVRRMSAPQCGLFLATMFTLSTIGFVTVLGATGYALWWLL